MDGRIMKPINHEYNYEDNFGEPDNIHERLPDTNAYFEVVKQNTFEDLPHVHELEVEGSDNAFEGYSMEHLNNDLDFFG